MAFDYSGDPALRPAVEAALGRVVDPEMALDILALGLVYRVEVGPTEACVTITMTSAACPVAGLILDEVVQEVERALPGRDVHAELCWDPAWTPERMSEAARAAMGWD